MDSMSVCVCVCAVGRTKALSSKTAHSVTNAVAAERCTAGLAVVQRTAQELSLSQHERQ